MAYERKEYRSPFLTTDIIIEHEDGKKKGIVLIERRNPPYGTALPGGFAEYGLSLEENAVKEALEETGLEVRLYTPEHPLCVKSEPFRDLRAHMVSVTYVGKGYGRISAGDDAKAARLYTLDEVKKIVKEKSMCFDHAEILAEYLKQRGEII